MAADKYNQPQTQNYSGMGNSSSKKCSISFLIICPQLPAEAEKCCILLPIPLILLAL